MRKAHFATVLLAAAAMFCPYLLGQTAESKTDPTAPPTPASSNAYVIGDSDLLAINVWKETDLTLSIPVRSDGFISLPLAGQIRAAGRTPLELQDAIRDRLRKYITDPQVTVIVMQINSQKVNVLGKVAKPGSYPLSNSMTVLDALASAGGFQDFAKKKAIYVLRKEPNGADQKLSFNYRDVIRGVHPEENIRLQSNDTVVVP
jgi:polysaccharide export outer membrane protein